MDFTSGLDDPSKTLVSAIKRTLSFSLGIWIFSSCGQNNIPLIQQLHSQYCSLKDIKSMSPCHHVISFVYLFISLLNISLKNQIADMIGKRHHKILNFISILSKTLFYYTLFTCLRQKHVYNKHVSELKLNIYSGHDWNYTCTLWGSLE